MSKHTPGPWHRNVPPAEKYSTIYCGESGNIQHIAHLASKGEKTTAEMEANCNLIAAAPELLESLTKLANIATHPKATKADIRMIARESLSAIAKATGLALILLTLTGCATTSSVVVRHDLPGGSVDYVATIQH